MVLKVKKGLEKKPWYILKGAAWKIDLQFHNPLHVVDKFQKFGTVSGILKLFNHKTCI